MDVTSLYTNIEHNLGVECIRTFLKKDLEISEQQEEFLTAAIKFILENNYFLYNEIYHQTKGTAMGTRMAPSYANLFMGSFEEAHIWKNEKFKSNILLYKRFIDDLILFMEGR